MLKRRRLRKKKRRAKATRGAPGIGRRARATGAKRSTDLGRGGADRAQGKGAEAGDRGAGIGSTGEGPGAVPGTGEAGRGSAEGRGRHVKGSGRKLRTDRFHPKMTGTKGPCSACSSARESGRAIWRSSSLPWGKSVK